ncbi:MAG: hypothetical protein CL920_19170 [Deltaproteobacteria bacterium]|nr:hypothetical protein [Deltaproteobacteria bacterium]|tara:strand:- start:2818 stop:3207 length:390 start_codon:yes stop_codon:yes gene_type:complete
MRDAFVSVLSNEKPFLLLVFLYYLCFFSKKRLVIHQHIRYKGTWCSYIMNNRPGNTKTKGEQSMKEGTLAYAVLLAVQEEPGITLAEIAKTIDEPINLVSGTLKYLINKEKLERKKNNSVYKYYALPED